MPYPELRRRPKGDYSKWAWTAGEEGPNRNEFFIELTNARQGFLESIWRERHRERPQVVVAEAIAEDSTPTIKEASEVMDGSSLIRAIEKTREVQPRVVALSVQLDAIITASRSNIAKDLKQGLFLLRETACATKKKREKVEDAAAAVMKERDALRVQLLEAEAKRSKRLKKPVPKDDGTPAGGSQSAKRTRQSFGDGTPKGS